MKILEVLSKPMKKLGLLLGVLIIFTSCSIEEEIHFNKDFSGKMTRTIDMRQMMSMAESMKSMGGDSASTDKLPSLPEALKQADSLGKDNPLTEKLLGIEGVSNVVFDADKSGKIEFSFDFANLDALNKGYNALKSMSNMGDMSDLGQDFTPGAPPSEEETDEDKTVENFTYFSRKGKYLIYKQPSRESLKANKKETEENEMTQMMKSMGNMMSFKIRMTFDRKIKKMTASNLDVETTNDGLVIDFGISSITDSKKNSELKLKLK